MYAHAHAPVRVEIAGGGTDLPAWTRLRPGRCLNLAVDAYCHAVAITRPDGAVVASYSRLEHVPVATEIANGLIRESALLHGWETGFEVHTLSEISSQGSGLGVSSSIAVCLSAVFARMVRMRRGEVGEPEDPKMSAAREAWRVEIDRLRRPIGRQDHMVAAWGGLRVYRFEGDEAIVERTFSYDEAVWLARHLVLVRLPAGHDSRAILSEATDPAAFQDTFDAVDVAVRGIENRDVTLVNAAITMHRDTKKKVVGSVTPAVEDAFRSLERISGVLGSTVLGAGGGGHILLVCEDGRADDVVAASPFPARKVAPDILGVRSEGWR